MAYNKNSFKSALGYEGKIFAYYKKKIEIQGHLLKTIQSALPTSLSFHALFCVISERKILLYTDSAVWSSQLRFYHQTILQAILKKGYGEIEGIQIKIIPKVSKPVDKKEKNLPSDDSINLILSQADNQTDDALKNALHKLGCTFQKKIRERS